MKKFKKFLKDLWLIAKGNKTILCSLLFAAVEAGLIPLTGPWLTFAKIILGSATAGSLYDHYKSGFFSKKKLVPEK